MYNPNLNSYACMYSYVQFPALQSHTFSDPNGINSCVGPYHVDQRFPDGRYHPASGIYFNEDFNQSFAGQTAYFNGAPQNVSSNVFTGMAQWPYPSQSSFQTQIQTSDGTNNGKFKLPPAPLHGFSCNAHTHNSPSAFIQGAWNFEAAASGEQMQIKENGDKIHSTADVAENCQHSRNVINEGHKNVAVFNEPQGLRTNKSDQNQWRYPDQHDGYANPLPPLQQFHIDPITKRPYLLDTPSVRPQMYEDISDDSEEDFKPLPETNNGGNHIISTPAFSEDHLSKQVGSKSYMKDAVYIPALTENNQLKDRVTSSNELNIFLDQLDSAKRQSEANKLFTSDLVTKASKKCFCVQTPELDDSVTIKTEVMSPKEELMTFDEDQPYEEEVTSYEEVKQTLPESVQISSLPSVGSRASARKQKNPRRSVPLKDPTFKGVVFTVQTRLLDKIPSLVVAPCRSSGRVGRRIRSLARRRSCSSSDTTSESDSEINNPVSPPRLGKQCASCNTRKTPLWRDAEDGTPLCNACGIRYKKYRIRCTRCWNIPKKDSKTYPRCSSCGSPLRYALIKKMIVN